MPAFMLTPRKSIHKHSFSSPLGHECLMLGAKVSKGDGKIQINGENFAGKKRRFTRQRHPTLN
jgi:hypothetical protein